MSACDTRLLTGYEIGYKVRVLKYIRHMSDFIRVATVRNVAPGNMKTVTVAGKKIMLANVNGQLFATDDMCTHAQCSLGEDGFLEGSIVICGCHGGRFDVISGKATALPAVTNVKTYEVKAENGDIFIRI